MWKHTWDVNGWVVGDNEGDSKFRKCTEGVLIEKCEKSGGKLLN